jgi:hypothetical protein
VALGFTATVNVDMAVASLEETVTVTGESPVIDTSATRVQQNYKIEQLNSIPNGRDMWALLAATPGVVMGRIDVGGNRAGTQTGYTAYGLNGQVRVSVEGINTTEGTGGAGFYFDYGSFEEVFLGVAGQGAEAATPGVQSQFLGKSGGNRFAGEFYADWYNNAFQGSNLSDEHINTFGLRRGSNECGRHLQRDDQRGAAQLAAPRQHHRRRREDREVVSAGRQPAHPRILRSVQHYQQQRRGDADHHHRRELPAADGHPGAADGAPRRAILVVANRGSRM